MPPRLMRARSARIDSSATERSTPRRSTPVWRAIGTLWGVALELVDWQPPRFPPALAGSAYHRIDGPDLATYEAGLATLGSSGYPLEYENGGISALEIVELAHARAGDAIDVWTRKHREFVDLPPLADHDLEYLELAERSSARDCVVSSSGYPNGGLLSSTLLDAPVAGDDDQASLGHDRNPVLVGRRRGYVARRPSTTVEHPSGVPRVGHVRPDSGQQMS
jgi:hypothetical protein